jgi:hypothetical protein
MKRFEDEIDLLTKEKEELLNQINLLKEKEKKLNHLVQKMTKDKLERMNKSSSFSSYAADFSKVSLILFVFVYWLSNLILRCSFLFLCYSRILWNERSIVYFITTH